MIEILTAACGGFLAGWICRAQQLPMGPPRGSYGPRLDEGRIQRGNQRNGGPTTPKPEMTPRLTFRPDWSPCSQPRPDGRTTNPPPDSP